MHVEVSSAFHVAHCFSVRCTPQSVYPQALALADEAAKKVARPMGRTDVEEIVLNKGQSGLGIQLMSIPEKGIFIQMMVDRGAAAIDGRLQIGDRLIKADKHSLNGMSHKQAVKLLQQAGSRIELVVNHQTYESWERMNEEARQRYFPFAPRYYTCEPTFSV